MTDIEKKALALLNEVQEERQHTGSPWNSPTILTEALYRAIEQHEAFRQEVSDAVLGFWKYTDGVPAQFRRFVIPKPDPLVEAWMEAWPNDPLEAAEKETQTLREALAKRGGKIVWENEQ